MPPASDLPGGITGERKTETNETEQMRKPRKREHVPKRVPEGEPRSVAEDVERGSS